MNIKNKRFNREITVGIPFHSGSQVKYLKSAVMSIINQSLQPEELHIIQDGPVVESCQLYVEEIKMKWYGIKHFILPKVGTAKALNYSIRHTKTTYYARMDSDDISFPDRLEKQFIFMENNPECDILGSAAIEFTNENNLKNGFIKKMPTNYNMLRQYFHYRNPLIHPSVMFRMSVFDKVGLYNEWYKTEQDLELWGRALRKNIIMNNISEPLLYFRASHVIKRRSSWNSIQRQIRARYSYNTKSIRLNVLKIMTLLSRFAPYSVQKYLYEHFR